MSWWVRLSSAGSATAVAAACILAGGSGPGRPVSPQHRPAIAARHRPGQHPRQPGSPAAVAAFGYVHQVTQYDSMRTFADLSRRGDEIVLDFSGPPPAAFVRYVHTSILEVEEEYPGQRVTVRYLQVPASFDQLEHECESLPYAMASAGIEIEECGPNPPLGTVTVALLPPTPKALSALTKAAGSEHLGLGLIESYAPYRSDAQAYLRARFAKNIVVAGGYQQPVIEL